MVSYFEHFCEDFARRQGLNVSVAREPYVHSNAETWQMVAKLAILRKWPDNSVELKGKKF